MLGKLLRHEFKSFGRRLFPLLPILVAFAGISCLLRELASLFVDSSSTILIPIFVILVILSVVTAAVSLIAPLAVPVFLLVQRYWRTMTSSEAYLTFTLPVKTSTHLWARLLSSVIYLASGILTTFLSSRLLLFIPFANINLGTELYSLDTSVALHEVTIWLSILLGLLCTLMQIYTAISVSTQFGKNRGIAAFIGWFLISSGVSSLQSGLLSVWTLLAQQPFMPLTTLFYYLFGSGSASSSPLGISTVVFFGTSLENTFWTMVIVLPLYYFLSRYLFTKKMALE